MENIWEYLRANRLSRLVWDSYDAIVGACKAAWDFLVNDPKRIASIGTRAWACVSVQGGWYNSAWSQPCLDGAIRRGAETLQHLTHHRTQQPLGSAKGK
jgi:hypothetical protein